MQKTLILSFLLMLTAFPLLAQSGSEATRDTSRTVYDIRNEGGNKYLKIIHELREFESDDRMQQAMKTAVMIPVASFMAPNEAYENLLRSNRARFTADTLLTQIREHGISGMDKLTKVLGNEIQKRNLVMFSEYHYSPHHRIVVEKLLPLFAESGYTYLALEALAPGQDSLLNQGHPPTIDSGFYTKDPRFSNLIRTAQALDFTLVHYENTDMDKDREEGQAENLYQATFAENKEAKVLVLAGMDHILEKTTSRGKKWLGTVLNEKYQLDPLTIGQHHLRYFENSIEDITLLDARIFENLPLNSVDFHLINTLPLREGESNFQFKNEYDHSVQLSFYLREEAGKQYDYDELIPVVAAVASEGQSMELHIPEADLELIIYDSSGTELERQRLQP